MAPKAQRHELQPPDKGGQEQGGRRNELVASTLGVELDDVSSVTDAALRHKYREDDFPEVAALTHHTAVVGPAEGRERRKQQRPMLRTKEGESTSSCNRRRFRRSRARVGTARSNKPTALVDAEMEMGLARGSRLAERAMQAVRQANAQVCLANLQVRNAVTTHFHSAIRELQISVPSSAARRRLVQCLDCLSHL